MKKQQLFTEGAKTGIAAKIVAANPVKAASSIGKSGKGTAFLNGLRAGISLR